MPWSELEFFYGNPITENFVEVCRVYFEANKLQQQLQKTLHPYTADARITGLGATSNQIPSTILRRARVRFNGFIPPCHGLRRALEPH